MSATQISFFSAYFPENNSQNSNWGTLLRKKGSCQMDRTC